MNYSSVSFFLTPGIKIPNPAKIAATSTVKNPFVTVPVFGNSTFSEVGEESVSSSFLSDVTVATATCFSSGCVVFSFGVFVAVFLALNT